MVWPWPGRRGRRKSRHKDEGGGWGWGSSEERKGETKRDDVGDERRRRVRREKKVGKMRVGCGKTGHAHE